MRDLLEMIHVHFFYQEHFSLNLNTIQRSNTSSQLIQNIFTGSRVDITQCISLKDLKSNVPFQWTTKLLLMKETDCIKTQEIVFSRVMYIY